MDNISVEFFISLGIQLIILAFSVGIYVTTIKFMAKQIEELKEDMRKYNNVLERLIITEQKASSAHHRLDTIEGKI